MLLRCRHPGIVSWVQKQMVSSPCPNAQCAPDSLIFLGSWIYLRFIGMNFVCANVEGFWRGKFFLAHKRTRPH